MTQLSCSSKFCVMYVLSLFYMNTAVESTDVPLSIVFVGDISFDGGVKYYVNHRYHSYNDTMAGVAEVIREADIAVGNLESPFVTKTMLKDKFQGSKLVFLDADACSAGALKFAGFDAMSLANNHMNDYGEKPVNFTRNILRKFGVESFGFNFGSYNTPQQPLILKIKGIKVGFLGYCDVHFLRTATPSCLDIRKIYNAGPAPYVDGTAARDVRALKREGVDIVVVYMHWGIEYRSSAAKRQVRIAKYLHSLGAAVVIGSHPHTLQPHIKSKYNFTAFSLGNFLFPQHGTNLKIFMRAQLPSITRKMITCFEKQAMNQQGPSKFSRILRIQATRKGVVGAQYIPLEIAFNPTNKCLQPTLTNGTHWNNVCAAEDTDCMQVNTLEH